MSVNQFGNGSGNGSGRLPNRPSVRAAAREYQRRGWVPIPLRPRSKTPMHEHWPDLRISEPNVDAHFEPNQNIGIVLGEASGNGDGVAGWSLVDVDCDTSEAAKAAAQLLPYTGCVSGRRGKPSSHYWYYVYGQIKTTKFTLSQMIIELRADGCQTMVPPSIHPSGELVYWEGSGGRLGEPARITARELVRLVRAAAVVAMMARHYPAQGTRDEAAMALTGMLLRGGWSAERADELVTTLAQVAGDEEWRKRAKGAQTAKALAAGEPVTGATRLAQVLSGTAGDGGQVVAKVRDWLGLSASDESPGARYSSTSRDTHARSMSLSGVDEYLGELDAVLLRDVEPKQLHWLWAGRIPLGTLTMLDGDPGLGKSLMTLDLIARLTTGRPMPGEPDDGTAHDGGAVLLSAEDDLATTIRPRLAAAGADVERVLAIKTVLELDAETGRVRERAFTLPQDIDLLEERIRQVGAKLVVIDPLMAYLDARVNSWRDQDVRATLAPLTRLAQRTGVAILILRHLTKGGGVNAVYRGGGSIGIIGAARSGLLVIKDPDNPETERVLASSKSNLGPPVSGLRYRITMVGEVGPRIEWLGTSAHTAETLLGDGAVQQERSALKEACAFLREALADGPQAATRMQQLARAAGISRSTLARARGRIGARARLDGPVGQGQWVWELPSTGEPPQGANMTPADAQSAPESLKDPRDTHAPNVSLSETDESLGAPKGQDAGEGGAA